MGKKTTIFLLVFLIALLVVTSYLSYLLYLDIYAESVPLISDDLDFRDYDFIEEPVGPSFPGESQFYQNMRFQSDEISYSIGDECNEDKIRNIDMALERLEDETLLRFYKESDAQIKARCEHREEPVPGEYFVAGEGGPTKIINTSLFYVIEEGEILLLYDQNKCNDYNIELHELLHVLGFKHSENPDSVMYNTTKCGQELTSDIVEKINNLYSVESLPDMIFIEVEANKTGRYLGFRASVKNRGLIDAEEVNLSIYSKEENQNFKKFETFDLGEVRYGSGKMFQASNVELPSRNVVEFKFVIEAGDEINYENSEIKLSIK